MATVAQTFANPYGDLNVGGEVMSFEGTQGDALWTQASTGGPIGPQPEISRYATAGNSGPGGLMTGAFNFYTGDKLTPPPQGCLPVGSANCVNKVTASLNMAAVNEFKGERTLPMRSYRADERTTAERDGAHVHVDGLDPKLPPQYLYDGAPIVLLPKTRDTWAMDEKSQALSDAGVTRALALDEAEASRLICQLETKNPPQPTPFMPTVAQFPVDQLYSPPVGSCLAYPNAGVRHDKGPTRLPILSQLIYDGKLEQMDQSKIDASMKAEQNRQDVRLFARDAYTTPTLQHAQ